MRYRLERGVGYYIYYYFRRKNCVPIDSFECITRVLTIRQTKTRKQCVSASTSPVSPLLLYLTAKICALCERDVIFSFYAKH